MSGSASVPNVFATQVGQVPASQLDANWNALTAYINTREIGSGTLAARPVTPTAGQFYFANNVSGGTLYFGNGSTWVPVTLGLVPASPSLTAPVTITDATGGGVDRPFLKLQETGSDTWVAFFEKPAIFGNSNTLSIAPLSDGHAALRLVLLAADGGQRVGVWDSVTTLPLVPHTSIPPTFFVGGDILAGDYVCLASNPMTLFIRANTNLPASAVTQFFSAQKAAGVEPDGGAQLILAPFKNGGGVINDGFVQIIAYGGGTGASANEIQFKSRSGSSTLRTTWHIGGGADAVLYPDVDVTYDIGTAANRVQNLFAKSIRAAAGTSSTMGFVPAVITQNAASASGSQANTNENDLKSATVPANTLATNGDALRITMNLRFANNATAKQVRLYYGGTVVLDSGASALLSNGTVEAVIHVFRTGTATQTVNARAVFSGNNQTWITAVGGATSISLLTVSNASGNVVKATSQQGAGAAANDVVQDALIIEYLRGT